MENVSFYYELLVCLCCLYACVSVECVSVECDIIDFFVCLWRNGMSNAKIIFHYHFEMSMIISAEKELLGDKMAKH